MIQTLEDLILFLREFHDYSLPPAPSRVPAEFPPPLAKFYSEFGGLIDTKPSRENNFSTPFDNQDRFESFERIKIDNGLIVFATENQGSWSCACSVDHLDTNVYCEGELVADTGFSPVCESLTNFIITLALQCAVMSCRKLTYVAVEDLSDAFIEPVPAIWTNGYCVLGEPIHNIFYDPKRNLIGMSGNGAWVGSQNEGVVFQDLFRQNIEHG